MSSYDTSQVCINGHLVCESIEQCPEDKQNFCSKCGAKTITNCPSCQAQLRGFFNSDSGYIKKTEVELYCFHCGKPYPWTVLTIESTKLLIQEDEDLDELQKSSLIETLPDIIVETPRTRVASVRVQKALKLVGKFSADSIRQFVIDFGCELAKKTIGL